MFACLSPGFYGGGERSCMNITGTRSSSLSPLFFSFNCAGARVPSSWHIHVTQRANGPYFSPNKLSLLASRKKGRAFFANRDKGRHRTWGPKIPLENMAERGKRGEGTRKRGRKEDVLGASSYGVPTLANSPFLEGEEKTAPDNYSITFPSSSPSGWELNPR